MAIQDWKLAEINAHLDNPPEDPMLAAGVARDDVRVLLYYYFEMQADLQAERQRGQRARELALVMWEHADAYGDYEIPPQYVHDLMYHLAPDVMQALDEDEAERRVKSDQDEADIWGQIHTLGTQTNTPEAEWRPVYQGMGLNAVLKYLQNKLATQEGRPLE